MKELIILLLACGFFMASLSPSAYAATMAKVDGIEVSDEMFEAFASSRARKPVADLTADERTALTEELIKLVVVAAQAKKAKLDNDSTISAQLELQELSFLAQAYIQREMADKPISEAQLKALYEEKYGAGSQKEYKARHILVSSPATATDIINELSGGANFVELAAKHSIGPSAKSGGDLGWFTKESMVPAFANAVAAMKSGTHSSQPVQSQYGWHVILKEDERQAPAPELSSVGSELQRQLQQQAVTSLVDGLRAKAKIRMSK